MAEIEHNGITLRVQHDGWSLCHNWTVPCDFAPMDVVPAAKCLWDFMDDGQRLGFLDYVLASRFNRGGVLQPQRKEAK